MGFVAGSAWLSHVVLDWLGSDSRPPLGLMALWPLSDAFFVAPFPVFMAIGRELSWGTLMHNTVAMAWESVLLVPLLAATRRTGRPAE